MVPAFSMSGIWCGSVILAAALLSFFSLAFGAERTTCKDKEPTEDKKVSLTCEMSISERKIFRIESLFMITYILIKPRHGEYIQIKRRSRTGVLTNVHRWCPVHIIVSFSDSFPCWQTNVHGPYKRRTHFLVNRYDGRDPPWRQTDSICIISRFSPEFPWRNRYHITAKNQQTSFHT